jgi:hypothetical protein
MAIVKRILIGCVILHNLIIEDESNYNLEPSFDVRYNVSQLRWELFSEDYYQGTNEIENVIAHYDFQNDLVKRLWA